MQSFFDLMFDYTRLIRAMIEIRRLKGFSKNNINEKNQVDMSWERKKLSKHQTSQLKHLSFLVSYHRFKFNEHIRLTTLHQLLCSLLDCVGNYL